MKVCGSIPDWYKSVLCCLDLALNKRICEASRSAVNDSKNPDNNRNRIMRPRNIKIGTKYAQNCFEDGM